MDWKATGIIVGLALAGVIGLFFYWSGGNLTTQTNVTVQTTPTSSPLTVTTTPIPKADAKIVKASIKTVRGAIELELYPNAAPKTVANFIKLANEKFYDGTKFHRVVPGFVIQGGDPLSKTDDPRVGTGGPGYQFGDEINPKALGVPDATIQQLEAAGYVYDFSLPSLPVDVGALAMANSGPNTNGSQFFIVTDQAQPHLNGKHTVFGKVISGMDVVHKIEQGDAIQSITISQ